jgi:hypothetical protein
MPVPSEQDHVLRPAGTHGPFRHSGGVRIVVHRDRQPGVMLATLTQRQFGDWDVNREHRVASRWSIVDLRADADCATVSSRRLPTICAVL